MKNLSTYLSHLRLPVFVRVRPRLRLPYDIVAAFTAILIGLLVIDFSSPDFIYKAAIDNGRSVAANEDYTRLIMHPKDPGVRQFTGIMVIDINYRAGQNSSLYIETQNGCIKSIQLISWPSGGWQTQGKSLSGYRCSGKVIDMKPHLHEGTHKLVITLGSTDKNTQVYVNPALIGAHLPSTLAMLMVCAGCGFLAYRLLYRLTASRGTAVLIMAGLCYCASWLILRNNLAYTNDLSGHIAYTVYMLKSWMAPFDYMGRENWHPPSYYYILSRIVSLVSEPGGIGILAMARSTSLVLYAIFCYYGTRSVRLALGKENLTYYIASFLIVFWPVNIIMGTRINNDVAMYALWSGSFYYLLHWHETRRLASLQLSLVFAALAVAVKSNGYVPLGILGVCVLWGLWTQRVSWSQLFWRRSSWLALWVLAMGVFINLAKLIHMHQKGKDGSDMHFGGAHNDPADFNHFFSFDFQDFIAHPFIVFGWRPVVAGTWETSYLNYFLKTVLYGEFSWNAPAFDALPPVLNLLLIMFILITLAATAIGLICRRLSFDRQFVCYMSALLPVVASMLFMFIKRWEVAQDFRFILPMLIPFVVLFAQGMEALRRTRLWPHYYIGMAVGLALPVCGMFIYLSYAIIFMGNK